MAYYSVEVVVAVVVVEVITGMVSGVEVETAGVVVVVEVITGEISSVEMVVVDVITGMVSGVEVTVDVVVVVVGVMIGGVEVATGSRTVSSGISEIIVDPRCLLSHSATAVTPSCQDS